jgi:hypothetical protein
VVGVRLVVERLDLGVAVGAIPPMASGLAAFVSRPTVA